MEELIAVAIGAAVLGGVVGGGVVILREIFGMIKRLLGKRPSGSEPQPSPADQSSPRQVAEQPTNTNLAASKSNLVQTAPLAETDPKMPSRHTADQKLSQIERRLLEAEDAIFKLYGIPPCPPPPLDFTLATTPGIERSIRFRFAFTCHLAAIAKSAGGADAIPFIETIFDAVTDSLEGYDVRVSDLFFESEPIETLTFSYSKFTTVNPELTGEVITNGLGAVQGLSAAFYKDFVSWLEMRLELGGGPMLMCGLTTGAATADVIGSMIVSQIVNGLIIFDDAQFADSIQLCLDEAENRHQYAEDAQTNKTVSLRTSRTDHHSTAKVVIEYSDAAKGAWGRIEGLPVEFQDEFLDGLDADTKCDASELAERIIQKHEKLLRPYDDDEANDGIASARSISDEAEAEFMKVYDLLGDEIKPKELLEKIEAKFGPSEQTRNRLDREQEAREAEEAREVREAQEREVREAQAREDRERASRKIQMRTLQEAKEQKIRPTNNHSHRGFFKSLLSSVWVWTTILVVGFLFLLIFA